MHTHRLFNTQYLWHGGSALTKAVCCYYFPEYTLAIESGELINPSGLAPCDNVPPIRWHHKTQRQRAPGRPRTVHPRYQLMQRSEKCCFRPIPPTILGSRATAHCQINGTRKLALQGFHPVSTASSNKFQWPSR